MQQIDLRLLGKGNYQLLNDVFFRGAGWNVSVLKGFVFDGASIPESLWSIVGCPTDFAFAGCIHDAIYRSRLLDRKTADKIFHNALLASGVELSKAKAMYLAVRVGGESAYDDARHMMAHYRNYVKVLPK